MKRHKSFNVFVVVFVFALTARCKLERLEPECPVVDSISPAAARFGETITIKGRRFIANRPKLYTVSIGGVQVPETDIVDVPDANTLHFKVPKKTSNGPVTVNLVKNPNCKSGSPVNFVYYYTATQVSKLMDGLEYPAGLDLDIEGSVVVAERNYNRIKVIRPNPDITRKGEIIKTHGIGFDFNSPIKCDNDIVRYSQYAHFNGPTDVDVDVYGNIYIADESNSVIRTVKTYPLDEVDRFAGLCEQSRDDPDGPRGRTRLINPFSIAKDTNNLYFDDAGSIKKIDDSGNVKHLTPKPVNGHLIGIEISHSRAGVGPIFVTDKGGSTVSGGTIKSIDEGGATRIISPLNSLGIPVAMSIDSRGNIFIADQGKRQIFVLYTNGVLLLLAGTGDAGYDDNLPAKFRLPAGIAWSEKRGALYVSDSENSVVRTIKIE